MMIRRPPGLGPLIRRIRWFHVPLTFAFTLAALGQLRKIRLKRYEREIRESNDPELRELSPNQLYKPSHLEISMYKMLPLRTLSRLWGWINSIELPSPIRAPILRSYANAFGCNLDEASVEDLRQYRNLGEFFRRSLKPGLRPISGGESAVVSPADGTVLHFGLAKNGLLEQVKGITYPLESFLGPATWKSEPTEGKNYQDMLLHRTHSSPTELYYCVIYLAPGDYHRFHSPVNWTVHHRRHFPGRLYSVRPTFASWFPNLFAVNERVAYVGQWQYGFFSMAPVGATNVGSMRIHFDPELRTNRTQMRPFGGYFEDKPLPEAVPLRKGDEFGEFNLGSTIVLVFEAPKNLQFNIEPGMKIKYGQLVAESKNSNNNKKKNGNNKKSKK